MAQLGELTEAVSTCVVERLRPNDQFTYIDLTAVDQEEKRIVAPRLVPGADAPSRARQIVRAGDVLVSTVRPNLNGVARVPQELDDAIASTGFCVLRPQPSKLDGGYLFHWVQSPQFVGEMVRRATGASYPAVSDRVVLQSRIPVPTLTAQRRIAAILDRAEALRAKRRAALAKIKGLKHAVFHDTFGRQPATDQRWTVVPVGSAGRVQLGRQRAPQHQAGSNMRPYVRVANVYEDRIDLSDVLSMNFDPKDFRAYKLEVGDILLNEGQSTELVGRPAMWRGEVPNCCFQNTLVRFQADPETTVPEFALAVFLHYFRSSQFARISSKTSNVAHLGAGRFAAMPFPLPPRALQTLFAKRLVAVDRLAASVGNSSAHVDALFSSLQHRAFRGEL